MPTKKQSKQPKEQPLEQEPLQAASEIDNNVTPWVEYDDVAAIQAITANRETVTAFSENNGARAYLNRKEGDRRRPGFNTPFMQALTYNAEKMAASKFFNPKKMPEIIGFLNTQPWLDEKTGEVLREPDANHVRFKDTIGGLLVERFRQILDADKADWAATLASKTFMVGEQGKKREELGTFDPDMVHPRLFYAPIRQPKDKSKRLKFVARQRRQTYRGLHICSHAGIDMSTQEGRDAAEMLERATGQRHDRRYEGPPPPQWKDDRTVFYMLLEDPNTLDEHGHPVRYHSSTLQLTINGKPILDVEGQPLKRYVTFDLDMDEAAGPCDIQVHWGAAYLYVNDNGTPGVIVEADEVAILRRPKKQAANAAPPERRTRWSDNQGGYTRPIDEATMADVNMDDDDVSTYVTMRQGGGGGGGMPAVGGGDMGDDSMSDAGGDLPPGALDAFDDMN